MPPEDREPRTEAVSRASIDEVYERVRAIGQENERILGDLIAGERRFRRLAKAVWQVQEDERRRLARELHDGIGQTLAALKNQLERLAAPDPETALGLRGAVDLATGALQDTRELSRLLRPPVLDDLGLPAALSWLGRTVGNRFDLEVSVESAELAERPHTEIETVLFRIAQEALTNAAKHSKAARVTVLLEAGADSLELTIADDGAGFDVERVARTDDRTGVGLRGMRDRVELFGGRLEVLSRPGDGTTIRAHLPHTAEGGP